MTVTMKVTLYCIYEYENRSDTYFEDFKEDDWEILKSFDLSKKADVRDFFTHLSSHYTDSESLFILRMLFGYGHKYDWINGFKYIVED